MPNLQHPETGAHTRASIATAKRLIVEGWEEIGGEPHTDAAPKAASKPTSSKKQTPPPAETPSEPAAPEKPLDTMKLTELITYAEKIGVPGDQVETLRKPGASKAKAIEIIAAHTASAE